MPKFSKHSLERLSQADPRLQLICNELIEEIDFSVLYSYRSPGEQFAIYKKGRVEIIDGKTNRHTGKWIKVGKVFTYKDGFSKKSYHNYNPSYAVDLKPYPVATNRTWLELANGMKRVAAKHNIPLQWGYDLWGFDKYHFQIPRKNWNDNIDGIFDKEK